MRSRNSPGPLLPGLRGEPRVGLRTFPTGAVTFLQLPWSNATEPPEKCSSYPVAMLRSLWRNITAPSVKSSSAPSTSLQGLYEGSLSRLTPRKAAVHKCLRATCEELGADRHGAETQMTKQAESCKTRSRRARKAVRKPPETVRKRNHLGSLPRLPTTRKAFSGSETAVPCSKTAPSGGAFFAIFILQINGTVRGGTVRGQFCSFGHYPPSPDRLASEIKRECGTS